MLFLVLNLITDSLDVTFHIISDTLYSLHFRRQRKLILCVSSINKFAFFFFGHLMVENRYSCPLQRVYAGGQSEVFFRAFISKA